MDIESKWSLDDVVKANILLNYNAEVREETDRKMKAQNVNS